MRELQHRDLSLAFMSFIFLKLIILLTASRVNGKLETWKRLVGFFRSYQKLCLFVLTQFSVRPWTKDLLLCVCLLGHTDFDLI